LCRNVFLNGCADSIVPLPVALSDKTALECFNYNNLSAGGSLHTLGVPVDFKGDPFTPVFRHLALSYRLDDFIRDFQIPMPNHIKIDVDGTEAAVLRGAKETLASASLRSLLVEAMPGTDETNELLDTLKINGFSIDSKHDRLFVDDSGRSVKVYNYIFVRWP
jgi:FkbM family methyltransferase